MLFTLGLLLALAPIALAAGSEVWVDAIYGADELALPLPANSALTGMDAYLQAFRFTGAGWEGSAPAWIRLLP